MDFYTGSWTITLHPKSTGTGDPTKAFFYILCHAERDRQGSWRDADLPRRRHIAPQDGDYFARSGRFADRMSSVRGIANTQRYQAVCQADRSPFARANSRVAVDQTGVGAFLNLARLPSATGNVIQSVVEQKQNTIATAPAADAILQGLNPAQQRAVAYGIGENNGAAPPLLIAAGAGTGKTKTLAHRVARLILGGVDPRRMLLLTFTRRAALEMTRRTQQILNASRGGATFGVDAELLP